MVLQGLAFAQQPLDQIIAEIFPSFQVHWQGSGAFCEGDGIQQRRRRQSVHQQVEIGMAAEAIIENGTEQMHGANLRSSLAHRCSRLGALSKAFLASLLQLLAIRREALPPILLGVNGHGFAP